MSGLVELIVDKYDGSLKAEHGTGINMAPYVEREWGERATELMWRVKKLADPDGVLSPGVVLNRDPGAHLRNLKTTPQIEESATTCVECGFCEPVCPSRNLTTTPRQRIVLRREMARQPTGSPVQRALLEEFEYEALETCAADGSCQLACPVGIDTGRFVKEMRKARHTRARRKPRPGHGQALGHGRGRLPRRPPPRSAGPPHQARQGAAVAGPAHTAGDDPHRRRRRLRPLLHQPHLRRRPGRGAGRGLGAGAGLPVWIPEDVVGSCCGLPWSSKGFGEAHRQKANEMVERLWRWSGDGALPIVDRRRLLHQLGRRPRRRRPQRGERRAPRQARDPRLGRLGPRPPAALARGRREGRHRHRPPDLRHPPPGPHPPPRSARRRPRRRCLRAADGDLLRLRRRPRHLPPRADRRRDPRPRRARSPAASSTPASPATAPARSASSAPPASPTSP